MAVSSVLEKMIGKVSEPIEFEVEKGDIRRVAAAVGETNPIHFDEEVAQSFGYPSLVATPTFVSGLQDFAAFYDMVGINPHTMMHQEEEYEYFKPIHAGDYVSVVHSVSNVYSKEVPNGALVFIVLETRGSDKRNRAIFKARRVLVELRR